MIFFNSVRLLLTSILAAILTYSSLAQNEVLYKVNYPFIPSDEWLDGVVGLSSPTRSCILTAHYDTLEGIVYFAGWGNSKSSGIWSLNIKTAELKYWPVTILGNNSNSIYSIAKQGDTLFLGGHFTLTIGNKTSSNFAAFNVNTGELLNLPNHPGPVQSLCLYDGKLYVGGQITYNPDNISQTSLIALDVNTLQPTSWQPNIPVLDSDPDFRATGGIYKMKVYKNKLYFYCNGNLNSIWYQGALYSLEIGSTAVPRLVSSLPMLDFSIIDNVIYSSGLNKKMGRQYGLSFDLNTNSQKDWYPKFENFIERMSGFDFIQAPYKGGIYIGPQVDGQALPSHPHSLKYYSIYGEGTVLSEVKHYPNPTAIAYDLHTIGNDKLVLFDRIFNSGKYIGDSIHVYCITPPPFPILKTFPTKVCRGQKGVVIVLEKQSKVNHYTWNYEGTGVTIKETADGATLDFDDNATSGKLRIQSYNDCDMKDGSVLEITLLDPPLVTITGSANTLTCSQNQITLSINGDVTNSNYQWLGPDNFSSTQSSVQINRAGTYSLNVHSNSSGCDVTKTITIRSNTVTPIPTVTASTFTLSCNATSITLQGNSSNPSDNFSWSTPDGTKQGKNITATIAGTYILTCTNPTNDCSAQKSIVIYGSTAAPRLTMPLISDIITCSKSSITLNASSSTPNTIIKWEFPSGSVQNNPATVTSAGTYTAIATDNTNGCTTQQTIIIQQDKNTPDINITNSGTTISCKQNQTTLTGSSTTIGVSYTWQGPNNFSSTQSTIQVNHAGTYTLTVKSPSSECSVMEMITIDDDTQEPTLTVTATTYTLTCKTPSITLTGSSQTSSDSLWWIKPSGTDNHNSITIDNPGTFTFSGFNKQNGCNAQKRIQILKDNTQPQLTIPSITDSITCQKSTLTLQASTNTANTSITWTSPNGTVQNNPAKITSGGTYTITATNNTNGCTTQATEIIKEDKNIPSLTISSSANLINCKQTNVTLTGSSTTNNVTYLWKGPGSFSANKPVVQTDIPGTYSFTVTSSTGCNKTNYLTIAADTAKPKLSISADTYTLTCKVKSITLTGNDPNSNDSLWWDIPTGTEKNKIINATIPGIYTLQGISKTNFCKAQKSTFILINTQVPQLTLPVIADTITCKNPFITATLKTTTPNTTLTWINPVGNELPNPTQLTIGGTYTARAADNTNGCTTESKLTVNKNTTLPSLSLTQNTVTLTCSEPLVFITANTEKENKIEWRDPAGNLFSSDTGAFISKDGTYKITVTNPHSGCTRSDVVSVTKKDLLDVSLGKDITLCLFGKKDSAKLTAVVSDPMNTAGTLSYSWSPNSSKKQSITVRPKEDTWYVVSVSSSKGCHGLATINVKYAPDIVDTVIATQPCYMNDGRIEVKLKPNHFPPNLFWGVFRSDSTYLPVQDSGTFVNLERKGGGTSNIIIRDSRGCEFSSWSEFVGARINRPTLDFLVTTYPMSKDTFVVVNISNPMPDSVTWKIDNAKILFNSVKKVIAVRTDIGAVSVNMDALHYKQCRSNLLKNIYVIPYDSTLFKSDEKKGITELKLSPNPNTGKFRVDVKLGVKQTLYMEVIDALGVSFYKKQFQDNDNYYNELNLNLKPGTYILKVVATYDIKQKVFVVGE